jgi:hypothetical protein
MKDAGRHEETGHEDGARCATMGALAGLLSGLGWLGVFAVAGLLSAEAAVKLGAGLWLVAGSAAIFWALSEMERGR